MSVAGNAITAVVALAGVLLGGWLTLRNQDRAWRREHARQWRDIRLATYAEFLTAYREYISFVLDPAAQIVARPHPGDSSQLMPFFDKNGRPYKEKLEAAKTSVRLVSELPATVATSRQLVLRARHVATATATHSVGEIPHEDFKQLWDAERKFLDASRQELGLSEMDWKNV